VSEFTSYGLGFLPPVALRLTAPHDV
jgi:hypothetical protein